MSKQRKINLLPISIIICVILGIITLYIVLNKGKIAGHSLVKIQTSSEIEQNQDSEKTLEISSEKKYLSSKDKEKIKINIVIDGQEVDFSEVELETSDESILKVEDGMAIAVSNGKATVTAKKGKLESKIDFRVITPITSMSFTTTNSTVRVGKSLQMKLIAKPSDASIETLKYTSSDEEIATVNSNGIVTGVAPGKVTITVTDSYTGLEKKVNLTIAR